VDDLGDLDAQEAGYCEGVSRDPWGYEIDPDGRRQRWGSDWFRAERNEQEPDILCGFAWEKGPAVLDAGPRTLIAALVPGGVWDVLSADPTACLALDIVIDGDTIVDLPPLPPCDADLSSMVFDPDPWRTPAPVDPSTPGVGTLRVTVPSMVMPDDMPSEHGGELTIVVLPAGTTLNEVGREQVWPSGGFRMGLEPRRDQQHIEELLRLGAVAVPIVAVPVTGEFGWFDTWWLAEAPVKRLPLTLFAPGDYDVYLQLSAHSEEGQDQRCGRTTVTIDGDLVVDSPELGECP
jgi:hypothetical protein